MNALLSHAHKLGSRVHLYTLNGHLGPVGDPYRFADDHAARRRWYAALAAGADWIASDEYEAIVRAFREPQP